MTPAQILPVLTADELIDIAEWLDRLPPVSKMTVRMSLLLFHLADELRNLADLRRKG